MADNAIWLQYKVLDNKAPLFCTHVSTAASAIAPRVTQQHEILTKKDKYGELEIFKMTKNAVPLTQPTHKITQTLFRQVNDSQIH